MGTRNLIVVLLGIIVLAVSAFLGLTAIRSGTSAFSTNGERTHRAYAPVLPSLKIKGDLMGFRTGDGKGVPYYVETILVPVVTYADRPLQLNSDSMTITYSDTRQKVKNLPWSARWIRGNAANDLLNAGELVEITLQVADLNHHMIGSTRFTLEFKPFNREPNIIKSATPANLDPIIIIEAR